MSELSVENYAEVGARVVDLEKQLGKARYSRYRLALVTIVQMTSSA